MAINKKQAGASGIRTLALQCSDPAVPVAGNPVRFGEYCGTCLVNEGSDGYAVIDTSKAKYTHSVKGINAGGNSAVALYDLLYYTDADTPKLSKKATGRLFGFANGTVGSGLTATIEVVQFGI